MTDFLDIFSSLTVIFNEMPLSGKTVLIMFALKLPNDLLIMTFQASQGFFDHFQAAADSKTNSGRGYLVNAYAHSGRGRHATEQVIQTKDTYALWCGADQVDTVRGRRREGMTRYLKNFIRSTAEKKRSSKYRAECPNTHKHSTAQSPLDEKRFLKGTKFPSTFRGIQKDLRQDRNGGQKPRLRWPAAANERIDTAT